MLWSIDAFDVEAYETADKREAGKVIFTFKLEVFCVSIEMLGLDDQGYLKGSHKFNKKFLDGRLQIYWVKARFGG